MEKGLDILDTVQNTNQSKMLTTQIFQLMQEKYNAEAEKYKARQQMNEYKHKMDQLENIIHDKNKKIAELTTLTTHELNSDKSKIIENQKTRIEQLELQIAEQKHTISVQQVEITYLRQQISKQEKTIEELKSIIDMLDKQMTELKADNVNLRADNTGLKYQIARLEKTCTELKYDHENMIIGQFAYEFCTLASSYITKMNKNNIKATFGSLDKYVAENSHDKKLVKRADALKKLLQNVNLLETIDMHLLNMKALRFYSGHPLVLHMSQDRIRDSIMNHPDLDDLTKNAYLEIVSLVHYLHKITM